jgi:hypothetical protein
MKEPRRPNEEDLDVEFVFVVEEVTARLLAGEEITPQSLENDYPHYASELSKLMSAVPGE